MEFLRSFPSVKFAVLTVDQSVVSTVLSRIDKRVGIATLLKEMLYFFLFIGNIGVITT